MSRYARQGEGRHATNWFYDGPHPPAFLGASRYRARASRPAALSRREREKRFAPDTFCVKYVIALASQMTIFDAVRLVGGCAESGFTVGFVIGIIPFEPHHAALAFKCQDVRRDTIQEPAIVTDDDRASGKIL